MVTLALSAGAPGAAHAGEWPQFQHDAAHTGLFSGPTTIAPDTVGGMRLRWSTHLASGSYSIRLPSAPVVAGNVVASYVFAMNAVVAVDETTGAPRWRQDVASWDLEPFMTTIGNGCVYQPYGYEPYADGVEMIDLATGAASCNGLGDLQTIDASIQPSAPVTAAGARVYVPTFDGPGVVVVDGTSLEWTARTGYVYGPPTLSRHRLFVIADGRLVAFPRAGCGQPTCRPLWRSSDSVQIDSYAAATVWDERLYVPGSRGTRRGLLVFAANGCGRRVCDPLWLDRTAVAPQWSPAVDGAGRVFAAAGRRLYGFTATGCGRATCAARFTGTLPAAAQTAPAIAGGVAFVAARDGSVSSFATRGCRTSTCQPLAVWLTKYTLNPNIDPQGPDRGLAIADGKVFVVDDGNWAYAFG